MNRRPRPPFFRLAAAVTTAALLLLGGRARALAISRRDVPDRSRAALARARYQTGVDLYAGGRYTEAYVAFQDAVTLDPKNRAARLAVVRVGAELARSGAPSIAPPPRAEEDWSLWYEARRLLRFERVLGDARVRLGELEALQGRIAQLLSERRVARLLGRPFRREAELHALSRRMSVLAS